MKPLRPLLLSTLLAAMPAFAGERPPAPDLQAPVYATRVDSHVEIGPDGRIVAYEPVTTLKEPLASRVRSLADTLRFEPVLVDGKPVIARTRMRMHLVAEPLPDGQLRVVMEDVGFPDGETGASGVAEAGSYIRGVTKRQPLAYPSAALRMGVSGRVLVALRLAPDGRVVEAMPRESALYTVKGRGKPLAEALALLERGATEAVRRWQFDVQVPAGARPEPRELTGLIAVEYVVDNHPTSRPGLWLYETRSQRRALPWLDPGLDRELPAMADVGDAGHFGAAPPRIRLLTEPQAGAL